VEYPSGGVYTYHGVPNHVNAALGRAESKMKFMAKYVKRRYRYDKQVKEG
jgi:hypothetical protein